MGKYKWFGLQPGYHEWLIVGTTKDDEKNTLYAFDDIFEDLQSELENDELLSNYTPKEILEGLCEDIVNLWKDEVHGLLKDNDTEIVRHYSSEIIDNWSDGFPLDDEECTFLVKAMCERFNYHYDIYEENGFSLVNIREVADTANSYITGKGFTNSSGYFILDTLEYKGRTFEAFIDISLSEEGDNYVVYYGIDEGELEQVFHDYCYTEHLDDYELYTAISNAFNENEIYKDLDDYINEVENNLDDEVEKE